ncbi:MULTISPECIES: ATP-binding cassette domain-containing protein [unclassified Kribbella]|uniref:ATP-binding cassette domain-containing protein n=1 Tax=unclassified Kribbella TaxID=2644121 RepID=UPI00301A4145
MEVVRLRRVSKRYGRRREVLADIDLQVAAGDLLALVGANGSGKSTVLKLMVGLSRPTSGTVRRNARVVSYVPDIFTSHDRLSASSYLRHMGRIRGLSAHAARARSDERRRAAHRPQPRLVSHYRPPGEAGVIAFYRYLLISVLLSQRYLPPTLIFLAAMAVGTTSDSGPLQESYAFCVLAMLVCTTWLTVSIVNHEDPTQRKITLVMLGGSLRSSRSRSPSS